MRIFISTGEMSGDLQGALLIEALKLAVAAEYRLEIIALGGDRMASAGAQLLGDTTAICSVGIWESLPYVLPTFLLQQKAKQYLRQNPPDLVVLLDYPGPNLSIGAFCRRYLPQVPIVYYIAPQTWVWSAHGYRETAQIVKITDLLLAVFPEEGRYFAEHGAKVTWVGHPLIDRMETFPSRSQARTALGIDPGKKAIALIPASRRQELKYLMPVMFGAAKMIQSQLTDVQFWIPLSREEFREPIQRAIGHYGLQATISSQTEEVLAAADLAITKSGTVNLEIALLDVPQVVIYRVSPITAFIARKLLKFSIPFMSPPNLVDMKQIVPEFLQEEATPEAIVSAGMDLLANPVRQQMLADYQQMRQSLGEPGVADRTAIAILGLL
ncbi:MAG: lipid-A-disaccharide synthase [Hormoscilla sp. GM102CHS1]|nr:lipid-A-disaccharide synthase [Hormoscilla sp. GM102CHS1]